jgi:DNA-directed RNA polymerase specialized sigma24 family protein
MDIKVLRATFREQLFKLDMFYHKRLRRDPRTLEFLETHKQELLGWLFEELVKIHNRPAYRNYDPQTLLFIKAKKVWVDFIRRLEREAKRKDNVNLDVVQDKQTEGSLQLEVESRDSVALIREFLAPEDFDLLQYRAEGFTYKQILEVANYASEDAAKTRYYRIKTLVKEKFRRFGL